ncbi:hypothetical protein [Streptomyces sp. NBC_00199]|jgi:hypothetical protein|uniref:hypothetical protein n=1 Tax=Streptomyces sp. NBC_00199 TaxID=2975678 RepID=UPI002253BD4D|nr:hypothetical protein [Streptomyces sp. NBC_00199]MCX5265859.1 hypothetical protein [Streptomyces sp. NBC_00199]
MQPRPPASRHHLDRAERGPNRLDIPIVDPVERSESQNGASVSMTTTITVPRRHQQRRADT